MNVEGQMEQAIKDAGFQVTDTPPEANQQPAQQEAQAPAQQEAQAPAEQEAQAPTQYEETAQPQQWDAVDNIQEFAPAQTQAVDEPYYAPVESGSSLTNQTGGSFESFLEAIGGEMPDLSSGNSSLDSSNQASSIDPRIQVISEFVAKTGRSPEDWFRYQTLDPSEMDDHTAVRVHMASEYPSLGNDEIDLLINSKYHTNPDMYNDDEIRLGNLQLKIDAQTARAAIDGLRSEYQLPIVEQKQSVEPEIENPFDENWISSNYNSLNQLEKISFDLPNGREFNYGVPEGYRAELSNQNRNMSDFFDRYVDDRGEWDHDLWNMHRTVTDNLPNILQSVYRQGMSDGQRNIVEKAANIDSTSPQAGVQRKDNSVAEQVLDALGRRTPFLKNL